MSRPTVAKLRPRPGDVIVLHTSRDPRGIIGALRADPILDGCMIVVMPTGDSMESLDATAMARAGWQRINARSKMAPGEEVNP